MLSSHADNTFAVATHVLPIAVSSDSERIQALRGIACILLVSFHVVQGQEASGLLAADASPYAVLSAIVNPLRMPLFTFLSGFVYAYRPVAAGAGGLFARKKIRRLLVPLVVVSTIFFIVQNLTPGTNTKVPWSEMWRIYLFSYVHFWFLQAIIIIFAVVALLDHRRLMATFAHWLAVFGVLLLLHLTLDPGAGVFSWRRAVHLAPFFLLGLAANRFRTTLSSAPVRYASLAAFAATMIPYIDLCLADPAGAPGRTTLWATAIGLSGCLTLRYWTPPIEWLAWVGGFSFAVYLYHVFFTAGARIGLEHAGIFNIHVQYAVGLLAGVMGPIIVEVTVRRNALARHALLGQS